MSAEIRPLVLVDVRGPSAWQLLGWLREQDIVPATAFGHCRSDSVVGFFTVEDSLRIHAWLGKQGDEVRRTDDPLRESIRALAYAHNRKGAEYERGGNAQGAMELRRVSNLLYAILDGTASGTVLP